MVSLLEIDKNRLDEYQAALDLQEKQRLEEQKQQQILVQQLLDNPMPRPEGPPKDREGHRRNPMPIKKASYQS